MIFRCFPFAMSCLFWFVFEGLAYSATPAAEVVISNQFIFDVTKTFLRQTEARFLTVEQTDLAATINADVNIAGTVWDIGRLGLGLCAHVRADALSYIDSITHAPLRVVVNADAVADTTTKCTKCFYVNRQGVHAFEPETSSSTSLQIESLDVWAGGLFPRLKARFGERIARLKMKKLITDSEAEISSQASSYMSDLVNKTLNPLLSKLQEEWNEWLYNTFFDHPYIRYGSMFFSGPDAIHIAAFASETQPPDDFTPIAEDAGVLNLSREYIERFFEVYFAGLIFSDKDVATIFTKIDHAYQSVDDVLDGDEDFLMLFAQVKPVELLFSRQSLTIRLNFERIEFRKRPAEGMSFIVDLDFSETVDGPVLMGGPTNMRVVSRINGTVNDELTAAASEKIGALFPESVINLTALLKKEAPWLPVSLRRINIDQSFIALRLAQGTAADLAAFRDKYFRPESITGGH